MELWFDTEIRLTPFQVGCSCLKSLEQVSSVPSDASLRGLH